MGIYEKLSKIQEELKAPKGQYNSFGKYKYRSCEDILEAVKPLLIKNKLSLQLYDELIVVGESTPTTYEETYYDKDLKRENSRIVVTGNQRYYIKATARLLDIEDNSTMENTAYAREDETKKGMDGSQITGTASSYARKYALNGLFLIDDTKDADTDEYHNQNTEQEVKVKKITKEQIKKLGELVDDIPAMLNYFNNTYKLKLEKVEDMSYDLAKQTIERKENDTKREDS